MTFGAEVWAPAAIQAAGSVASGYLAGQGAGKETKMQKTQRKLVDQLLASLTGEGPYSALFDADEDAFLKSFVQPAQSMFNNQIAPQIQQQYIASGQQRGTGLDDQLLRAGVDLDSLLNSQFYQFNQDALNRKQNVIGNILGGPQGAPNENSTSQNIMQSLSGYLSSQGFADTTSSLFKKAPEQPARKGFEAQP